MCKAQAMQRSGHDFHGVTYRDFNLKAVEAFLQRLILCTIFSL